MHFAKGHGTENDFVILPDPDAELDLTPDLAAGGATAGGAASSPPAR